ncbi:DNA polymerase III subunit delta [bacterium]|nr:DNA polymerase III subunit delta [bacterium]
MKNYPPSIKDLIDFGKSGGIFFVHCPERYVLKTMKTEISALSNADNGVEVCFFDAGENKNAVTEAVGTASEMTLFATCRIIALEIPEKLAETDLKMLERYIDSCETANFLIVFLSEIDKRLKFFKSLQKMTKIYFPVPLPSTAELKNFIKNEFSPFTPDENLVAFFLNGANQDMFFIHNEIEKLKLYAEAKQMTEMKYDKMSVILNDLSEQVIFKIMDMLVSGKKAAAISLYRETLIVEAEQKVNPMIISMFFKHFKAIMQIKIMVHEGKNSEISSYLAASKVFYMRGNASAIAAKYKNSTVIQALRRISKIELGMKGAAETGTAETNIEIERFMSDFFL